MINSNNPANITEYSENLITETQGGSILLSLAFPGIGLPSYPFNIFMTDLEYVTGNQFKCTNSSGGYCSAPYDCASYNGGTYDLSGYEFKAQLTQGTADTTYIRISLFDLMRNNGTT